MTNLRTKFFLLIAGLIIANGLLWGVTIGRQSAEVATEKAALSKELLLTDLALSTESRHTRNIALPEPIAPFQDFPGYHGHFPSSTFMGPPTYIFRLSPAPQNEAIP